MYNIVYSLTIFVEYNIQRNIITQKLSCMRLYIVRDKYAILLSISIKYFDAISFFFSLHIYIIDEYTYYIKHRVV